MKNIIVSFLFVIFFSNVFSSATNTENEKTKVIIGGYVCQKDSILTEFFKSLNALETDDFEVEYYFIDRKLNDNSRKLVENYLLKQKKKCTFITSSNILSNETRSDKPYDWITIDINARLKNHVLKVALDTDCDYLFLLDSSTILHPKSLKNLIKQDKEIIGSVVWTANKDTYFAKPNVGVCNNGALLDPSLSPDSNASEKFSKDFIDMLVKPGIYEVGAIESCVLISKNALKKGVSFKLIKNLCFCKEDTHFALRATALKIPIFVDTNFPGFYLNDSSFPCLSDYLDKNSCININNVEVIK